MLFLNNLMKQGYIVEVRMGDKYFVFEENISNNESSIPAYKYNESLKHLSNSDYDIVRIFKPERYHTIDYMLNDESNITWTASDYDIDLSKLKIDTPMIVYQKDPASGIEVSYIRYLAFVDFNKRQIYCWNGGCTSLSVVSKDDYTLWNKFKVYTQ